MTRRRSAPGSDHSAASASVRSAAAGSSDSAATHVGPLAAAMPAAALAASSLRFRAPAFAASFLAVLLGSAIVMAFASLLDTAAHPAAGAADDETLATMASVVGFWGLVIVVFAVASTLTLSVRQRAREVALLKSIGATPGQVTRMVVGEALVVALAAAVVAVPLGYAGGAILFDLLQDGGRVGSAVDHRFGGAALGMGIGIPLLAAAVAALLASRRAARMLARDALAAAELEPGRMSRKRAVAGALFVLLGADLAVVTATVFDGKGIDAMQTAGQASIWASIGLALLAPAPLRGVARVLAPALERLGGASGHLTVEHLRGRAQAMGGALMPIVLLVGIATGCLTMQAIENGAPAAAAATTSASDAQSIETLNFVVVAMIALFAAITVVNTLVAATTYRRREFAQQRLAGATPGQVLATVALETGVLTGAGVVFGGVASLATIVPYSLARTGDLVPSEPFVIFPAIALATVALTFAASLGTARRAIRDPAIEAVRPRAGAA